MITDGSAAAYSNSVLYSKGHFIGPSNKHLFSQEMLSLKIRDGLLSFFAVFPTNSVGFMESIIIAISIKCNG